MASKLRGRRSIRAARSYWHSARSPSRLLCVFVILFVMVMLRCPDWPSLISSNQMTPLRLENGTTSVILGSLSPHGHLRTYNVISEVEEEGMYRAAHTSEDADYREIRRYGSFPTARMNSLSLSYDLKIYVYDLPSRFNMDWMKNERCGSHLFAAEVAVHQRLLESSVRTMHPEDADFFFVPVYVSCRFSRNTGFPSVSHARSLLHTAVKLISRQMPYWNRSEGKDHIFVATHDYGPCFRTMEDLAVVAGIPTFLKNSLILQTFGQVGKHPCQATEHIQIPPFVPPTLVKQGWHPEKQHRHIWAFFRGKVEVHPKNVSGRVYSRGVRTTIWHKFHRNRKFFIKRTQSPDYFSEMQRSVFCLCPLGWAPWSPRIVESVLLGCVPVIIADKITLPYSHVIDWGKISVTVPEKDVGKLGKILDRVSRSNLSIIQESLWKEMYRRALMYMEPLSIGDATWQILELLARRKIQGTGKPVKMVNQTT